MYHGPWVQFTIEHLENLFHFSQTVPRPHPYEPAIFHNIVHIRKAVDEATDLAVRAASGVSNGPSFSSIGAGKGIMNGAEALGITLGARGQPVKLSKERQGRMREMAIQKLAEAYRLDEIATSVATMQSASTLDELAKQVLQRSPKDPDARYVHFFHEKIPTRKVAEFTTLDGLDELIKQGHHAASALRTRAVTKIFKEDYEGAVQDLTEALREAKHHTPIHSKDEVGLDKMEDRNKRLLQKGIELQLYFYRANVYLRLATQNIQEALDMQEIEQTGTSTYLQQTGAPSPDIPTEEAKQRHLEMRKSIKTSARRALKDYMSFLSMFEYAPSNPSMRPLGPLKHLESPDSVKIYKISDLFQPSPPKDLPQFPPDTKEELECFGPTTEDTQIGKDSESFETISFHPLLPEALCSLLICHAILQTSPTELRRHAYMAARLIRLSAGVPVFSIGRAGSGADFGEIVEATSNWLDLKFSWTDLCGPRRMSSIEDDDPGPRNGVLMSGRIMSQEEKRDKVMKKVIAGTMRDPMIRRGLGLPTLKEKEAMQRAQAQFPHAAHCRHARPPADGAVQEGAAVPAQRDSDGPAGEAPKGGAADGAVVQKQNWRARKEALHKADHERTAARRADDEQALDRMFTDEELRQADDDDLPVFTTARAEAVARWVTEAPAQVEGEGGRKKKRVKRGGVGLAGGGGRDGEAGGGGSDATFWCFLWGIKMVLGIGVTWYGLSLHVLLLVFVRVDGHDV